MGFVDFLMCCCPRFVRSAVPDSEASFVDNDYDEEILIQFDYEDLDQPPFLNNNAGDLNTVHFLRRSHSEPECEEVFIIVREPEARTEPMSQPDDLDMLTID